MREREQNICEEMTWYPFFYALYLNVVVNIWEGIDGMQKYSHIICSLILAAAFLGGCYILAERGEDKSEEEVHAKTDIANKSILTESELADYLGIPMSDLQDLLELDRKKRENLQGTRSYDTYSILPSMVLPNRSHLFLKSEVDKWVEYQIMHGL